MRALVAAVLLTLTALVAVPAVTDALKLARPAVPPAQQRAFGEDRPVEKLSLSPPSWEHAGGLLVGKLTVRNGNDYPVNNVIIACDFFDASGHVLGTRGTAIRRIFEPGETRIDGIEFIRFARNMHGGECRTLSAKATGSAQLNDME
ncbi:MAG TPA: hypothetical protein VF913_18840 [Xanthobacteraceae bacterium]